jgi:predicted  nucleic acid-binding Zn-ribbon protein
MADTWYYCCTRCGEIFESETEEQLCPSCREVMTKSAKHREAVTFPKPCEICGETFAAKSPQARFCPACRVERRREQSKEWDSRNSEIRKAKQLERYYTAKARDKSLPAKPAVSIAERCRQAAEMGLTYGQYMAKFG